MVAVVLVVSRLALSDVNVSGAIERQRVPASPMTAIALRGAVMTGAVACSSSSSQEVSFPAADGGTVAADLLRSRRILGERPGWDGR
jgi:hypothetical protein